MGGLSGETGAVGMVEDAARTEHDEEVAVMADGGHSAVSVRDGHEGWQWRRADERGRGRSRGMKRPEGHERAGSQHGGDEGTYDSITMDRTASGTERVHG